MKSVLKYHIQWASSYRELGNLMTMMAQQVRQQLTMLVVQSLNIQGKGAMQV
jgi:hypothetical protein